MTVQQDAADPAEMLPLTHLSYHIMLALRNGALHGYGISKTVDEMSRGRLTPGTGTFYSAIRRMLDEGVLEEVGEPADAESHDSRRRYYGLTQFGRRVMAAEGARLADLVSLSGSEPSATV
jgi:DNA-binding PadR family transcriptional regulator